MQVILLEKVVNLGDLGDVVRVRNGYARNFLIPRKIARRATAVAIQEFEVRRAELEKAQAERLAAAQSAAGKLAEHTVKLLQKAGVDGRLFGSVTTMDIAASLAEAGFSDIVRSQVRLPDGPLKAVGEYEVQVVLHPDVTVDVTVIVEGDLN
ncbi:50S ribosomal protein L9 [Paenalcaligenes niemegkensis]|uniref:50S ribosomal protein L9 n=1 Tax=Paenalcaligenes niemegkensis TaxID=2895469 RepID=UPI001EE982E8|nr:50S ribosomal protein L9 [Paenalcaligenes niemegkensis]MCQ9615640.1 50S ribosomal protein L9 [Paenalcaligenes niemegkensis]